MIERLVMREEMTSGEAGGMAPWEDARPRSLREVMPRPAAAGSLRREVEWRAWDCLGMGGGAVEASMLNRTVGLTRDSPEKRCDGHEVKQWRVRTVCGECLVGGSGCAVRMGAVFCGDCAWGSGVGDLSPKELALAVQCTAL